MALLQPFGFPKNEESLLCPPAFLLAVPDFVGAEGAGEGAADEAADLASLAGAAGAAGDSLSLLDDFAEASFCSSERLLEAALFALVGGESLSSEEYDS